MSNIKLLLGDEAIALGAIHAGISGVYAYPGTPSTEITEFIQNNVHSFVFGRQRLKKFVSVFIQLEIVQK